MKIYSAYTQTCVLKFCLFDKISIRTCVFAHMLLRPHVVIPGDKSHSVYSIFEKKNSRIRKKQMFTNARAFSRVSYFLYFSCFSHMFCGKKVVVVFL